MSEEETNFGTGRVDENGNPVRCPLSPWDIPREKTYVGSVFVSNEGDYYIVIDRHDKDWYRIKFLDAYGYEYDTYRSCVVKGAVKNPYHPNKYGGVIGVGPYSRSATPTEYNAWLRMLQRVSDSKSEYFNKDEAYRFTSVAPVWMNLQNFGVWFTNYMNTLNPNYKYQLDKDVFQYHIKYKVYSPETTCLIPDELNNALSSGMVINITRLTTLPIGVAYRNGSFYPNLTTKSKHVGGLGHYSTPEEAFEVYKREKIKYLREMVDRLYNDGAIHKDVKDAIYNLDIRPYIDYDDVDENGNRIL